MATQNTLIAVYKDRGTAERAADAVIQSGVSRGAVQVMSADQYAGDIGRGNTGLTGNAPTGSSGGGFMGFLNRLFGNTEDAVKTSYSQAIERGNSMVTVDADAVDQERITEILDRYNPIDMEQQGGPYRGANLTGNAGTGAMRGEQSMLVVEEQINVDKRAVNRGGVRLHRTVTERPVQQDVNLREEHVHVDRRPVDRPASEADFRPGDQVIEVTEMAEEAVIGKQARVVEEVVVTKEANTRKQTVQDTVRRSDVNVENLGQSGTSGNYDDDFRRDFQTRYGTDRNAQYETYAPAYQYGYRMANDQRYRGKSWNEVESQLKTDYERNNPNSAWDRTKGAIRYGWERVTGQR